MSPNEAKAIIKGFLTKEKLPFTKLTARTVGFSDLARASCVFVTIHGWKPHSKWVALERLAIENGFCVEAE